VGAWLWPLVCLSKVADIMFLWLGDGYVIFWITML
jgi:hypothetical protein